MYHATNKMYNNYSIFNVSRFAYIHPYITATSKLYLVENKSTETGNFCGHSIIYHLILYDPLMKK